MRKPDLVIGVDYLSRWYLIPKNKWFNIYLHRFTSSDEDRALHDHPWWSVSFLLFGMLVENYNRGSYIDARLITWGLPMFRSATFAHRIILLSDIAWTLFITGPKTRSWGFHTEDGWVPWREFLGEDE